MPLFRLRKRKGERYAASPFNEALDRGAYLRPKRGLTLFNRQGQTIRPGSGDRYVMVQPVRAKRRKGGGLFGGKPERAPNPNRGKAQTPLRTPRQILDQRKRGGPVRPMSGAERSAAEGRSRPGLGILRRKGDRYSQLSIDRSK